MLKLYGLTALILADLLLVKHMTAQKKQAVQCLQEMIVFVNTVTYGVTEWKKTLEEAILTQQRENTFPKMFQQKFLKLKKVFPLRDALKQALKGLPLSEEATELMNQYLFILGKDTKKSTQEHYQHIKSQLKTHLDTLQKEFPKEKKMITAGVCSASAMVAILIL